MVKFFKQSHHFDESWPTVTLAFFLRYPNPYATHVLSADVISRSFTPQGTLLTTRLILKRGAIPKWVPQGIVSRAESWIVEQSEVDPLGKVVRCETRNLDHVKIMSVRELVELREGANGSTRQKTQAEVVSKFGWGLAKRIERYGHEKFQRNIERSRAGISLIVDLLHQSRLQPMGYNDVGGYHAPLAFQGTALDSFRPRLYSSAHASRTSQPDVAANSSASSGENAESEDVERRRPKWSLPRPMSWFRRAPPPSSADP